MLSKHCHAHTHTATIPDSTTAMSLAAPAVALANTSAMKVGHTAPLLPTPPSMTSILGNALTAAGPASVAFGNASASIVSLSNSFYMVYCYICLTRDIS